MKQTKIINTIYDALYGNESYDSDTDRKEKNETFSDCMVAADGSGDLEMAITVYGDTCHKQGFNQGFSLALELMKECDSSLIVEKLLTAKK